jgi:hypothetical protein
MMDIKINGASFGTATINNGTNVFVWNGYGGPSTIDANAVSGVEFVLIIF